MTSTTNAKRFSYFDIDLYGQFSALIILYLINDIHLVWLRYNISLISDLVEGAAGVDALVALVGIVQVEGDQAEVVAGLEA